MRQRIKRGVVYHATPSPHYCFMAKSEVLANKHRAGNISKSEMEELAAFRALLKKGYKVTGAEHKASVTVPKSDKPKMITIRWGGMTIQITESEYNQHHCKQLGF